MADPGDVIELAVGRHKLAGREIELKPGLIIRTDTGMPGLVEVEEVACDCDDWRDCPIFVLDDPSNDPVIFDGITFKNFTLSCDHYPNNPAFHVVNGTLSFSRCEFVDFYKTTAWFEAGTNGAFNRCSFIGGAGIPSTVHFAGETLQMSKCLFNDNTWIEEDGAMVGSILRLVDGQTYLDETMFEDNGPLIHLVTVGPEAQLMACTTCFADNMTAWEGEVAGQAILDCCTIDPVMWNVVGDGDLVIIDTMNDPSGAAKAMQVENRSLTDVKNLFQ
jgi:hypothetical protein